MIRSVMILSSLLLVTRIDKDPIKAKESMVGEIWEMFPCFRRGKNLTFNEIAALMYQPDLTFVLLLDL